MARIVLGGDWYNPDESEGPVCTDRPAQQVSGTNINGTTTTCDWMKQREEGRGGLPASFIAKDTFAFCWPTLPKNGERFYFNFLTFIPFLFTSILNFEELYFRLVK